jgi:iron(III) transport system substrate-binding protein
MKKFLRSALAWHVRSQLGAQGQVNVICSVQAEWCNMISTVYARTTGDQGQRHLKGSGEALAQLIAEKDNPKTDVWFGGTGDPHLQAAEQGLRWSTSRRRCRSMPVGAAAGQAIEATRRSASTPARWASATTPSCWRRRSCPCPGPGQTDKRHLQGRSAGGQPASSGTAYTMIATLVQLMGEDKAFDTSRRCTRT